MRYYEYIIYKRVEGLPMGGATLQAYRVSGAHGHHNVKRISFTPLFAGHANWCADQIEQYEALKAKRRSA